MKHSCAFLITLLIVFQCGPRVSETAHIDPGLRPIVESFLREASARDIDLSGDLKDLIIRFGKIEGRKGGSCKPDTSPRIITIDSLKWKLIDATEQETLLFHELAHCVLMRPHNNAVLEFGACKSLLRENVSRCHLNWGNAQWRSYYLNELFDPGETSGPDWYEAMLEFCENTKLSSRKKIRLHGSRFQYFDSSDTHTDGDWAIIVVAQKPETGHTHTELTLNEIMLSISFMQTDIDSGRLASVARLHIMDAATRKRLIETIIPGEKLNLTLRKHRNAIYVLFDGTLQYVLPVNPANLRIGCYSTLPEDCYNITFNLVSGGGGDRG